MKRCLHITIHESLSGAQRRGSAYPSVRPGTDPGTNYVMPDPDDPGTNRVMPDPDDPGTNYVMPDPDDPRSGPYPSGGHYGHPGITVHECGCVASPGPKPEAGSRKTDRSHPFIAPRHYSGFVVVRLAEGVVADGPAKSLWTLAAEHKPRLTGLQAVLALPLKAKKEELASLFEKPEPPDGGLGSRPLVELPKPVEEKRYGSQEPPEPDPLLPESFEIIRDLEKAAATTAFPPLHSLTAYWRLDLREHPSLIEKVVARLNRLVEVDLAYRELTASDPQQPTEAGEQLIEDQGYLADAPVGIGASWALKNLNGTTSQVTLCDLEQGWTPSHQELTPIVPSSPFYGSNKASDGGRFGHHGTAVLGQLAATGTGPFGLQGAPAGFGRFVLASHYRSKTESELPGTNGHVVGAIVQALAPVAGNQEPTLKKGSILLLEIQRGLLPTEIDEADFDAIRLASAHGVIVVEAAGNGGFDLDAWTDPATGRSLRRGAPNFRDSGAILVGAARAGLPHNRAPFSNYGSRVDCFGWGESVTTSGYGDLAGTVDTNFYTNAFSGTSSASPMIAGAAALVQALHKERAGYWLGPRAMRTLLSDPETGTRQGSKVPGHIGVMPDLQAILRGRLQIVPDVYMRRCVNDHDSKRGKNEEISSSPDIILWKGSSKQAAKKFGEGSRANDPAPGSPINPGAPDAIYSSGPPKSNLYVRLRNRGLEEGNAEVRVFASPAATLITPERWMPVTSFKVDKINQGDGLRVSDARPVNPPEKWPQEAPDWTNGVAAPFSFLAVQLPWDGKPDETPNKPSLYPLGYEKPVLPPGPPYFDWDEYRSFLRGPGVTWRNVHPVQASADMTLTFLLAGTPDRTRSFDFEVIQRLPDRAKLILALPPALAAKLRQRLPWLANDSGELELPHRPRTALGRVALAPGSCAHASFHVVAGASALLEGHSLAIRQLWRGEEVGRITWWFVKE